MTLHTADLELRTVTNKDLAEVSRMWKFEQGPIPLSEGLKAIDRMQADREKNGPGRVYHLCLAVYMRGHDEIIGWCGLDGRSGDEVCLFYMVDSAYRGRGYATQCAARVLDYAFGEAGLGLVTGGCDRQNAASYRVMEKAGMVQRGFEANGDPLFYMDGEGWRGLARAREW